VLVTLGLDETAVEEAIEVFNKIDLLSGEELAAVSNEAARRNNIIAVSALEETGVKSVLDIIEARLADTDLNMNLTLPYDAGDALAWLYEQGAVTARIESDLGIELTLSLSKVDADRFEKRFEYNFT